MNLQAQRQTLVILTAQEAEAIGSQDQNQHGPHRKMPFQRNKEIKETNITFLIISVR